jgi:hypothetical protein
LSGREVPPINIAGPSECEPSHYACDQKCIRV